MSDTTKPAKSVAAPSFGAVGLKHFSGYLGEEWDRRLQGAKGPKAWIEMSTGDATVGALLHAFYSLVLQAGYRIEPADETPEAESEAQWVRDRFDDLEGSIHDTFGEMLTALPFGFALMVPVYKLLDDGRIGWLRWSPRAQETIERWEFDDEDRAVAAIQVAPPKYRVARIPLDRCMHFRIRQRKASPEGTSILRNAYESWYYKKNLQRIEAIMLERGGAGYPKASIPGDVITAAGADYDSYVRLVTQVRVDEQAGIVIPSDRDESGNRLYDFEFIGPQGTTQFNTDVAIGRYERYILRTALADFLTQGDTGVGSYAQSVSRTALFESAVNGMLGSFADIINTQGIYRLYTENPNVPIELAPHFVFNDVAKKDLLTFARVFVPLVQVGAVDVDEPQVRQYVYDTLGLTMAQETEDDDVEDNNMDVDELSPPAIASGRRRVAGSPRRAVEPAELEAAVEAFNRWVPDYAGLIDEDVVSGEDAM